MLLVGYSCVINMYLVSYPVDPTYGLITLNWFVEGMFYLDFILNFFQTYIDEKTFELITDRKEIALKYLYSWLIIDLLSIIPFNVMFGESG